MEETILRTDTKTMSQVSLRLIPGADKGELRQAQACNKLLEALDKTAAELAEQIAASEPRARLYYTVQACQCEDQLHLTVTLVCRTAGLPSRRKTIFYRFRDGCLLEERVSTI